MEKNEDRNSKKKLWKNKLMALMLIVVLIAIILYRKDLIGIVAFITVPLSIGLLFAKEDYIS